MVELHEISRKNVIFIKVILELNQFKKKVELLYQNLNQQAHFRRRNEEEKSETRVPNMCRCRRQADRQKGFKPGVRLCSNNTGFPLFF